MINIDFNGYVDNFFNTDYMKTYLYIIGSFFFSFLVLPYFVYLGYVLNIVDKSSSERDFMKEINSMSGLTLMKEGFIFFLFHLVLGIILLVLLIPVTFLLGGAILFSPEAIFGTLLSVILLIPLLMLWLFYAVAAALSYTRCRSTYEALVGEQTKKLLQNGMFYLLSFLLLVFPSVITPSLEDAPLIGIILYSLSIPFLFGFLGLLLPDRDTEDEKKQESKKSKTTNINEERYDY